MDKMYKEWIEAQIRCLEGMIKRHPKSPLRKEWEKRKRELQQKLQEESGR